MLLSILVYAALTGILLGLISLKWPLRFLRLATRKSALVLLGTAALLLLTAVLWPVPEYRATQAQSRLDEWLPVWQFSEFHSLRVQAPPEKVYRAIREVTGEEILLLQTLTWIRNPGRLAGQESLLNPPAKKPILEVAMAGGFRLAAEEPPGEIALLALVLWDGVERPPSRDAEGLRAMMQRPGNAIAGINFRVRDEGHGWCTLTTETRVYATDAGARRTFARYWRVIYPGSSLLRYTWLRAIRTRAEK